MNGTHSYGPDKDKLQSRLRRIEGQVRGVQKMVEADRYCVDILAQLAAIKSATHQVALNLLESHTHHCVKEALKNGAGGEEKLNELVDIFRKFTKA